MDGRDTPPESGIGYIRESERKCARSAWAKIATVGGRYYAMDRDKRWERSKGLRRDGAGARESRRTDPEEA
jgi:2,3-bisphosphoglycerate-independent phosphoglycerate mutase